MTRTGQALLLAIATSAAIDVGAQDVLPPFAVGVLVDGGQSARHRSLVPFADFDGRWHTSWPKPLDTSAGAPGPPPLRSLLKIPPAWWGPSGFQRTWEALEPGGRRRSFQVTATKWASLGSSCSANVGLNTDVPAAAYGYQRVLASSHPGVVTPISPLTVKSPEWRAVAGVLPGLSKRLDAPPGKGDSVRWDAVAPGASVKLKALFRTSDSSGDYFYFSSSRVRTDLRTDTMNGWLWRQSATSPLETISIERTANNDDVEKGSALTPLGVVNDGSRRFWIGSISGYAYGALTVLDVRRGRVKPVVLVEYSGC